MWSTEVAEVLYPQEQRRSAANVASSESHSLNTSTLDIAGIPEEMSFKIIPWYIFIEVMKGVFSWCPQKWDNQYWLECVQHCRYANSFVNQFSPTKKFEDIVLVVEVLDILSQKYKVISLRNVITDNFCKGTY